jgi:hypothetical protein
VEKDTKLSNMPDVKKDASYAWITGKNINFIFIFYFQNS